MANESEKLTSQLRTFLATQFGVSESDINNDLTFGDLPQWDSLGHMSLMAAIEEKFGVEVNADAIADLVNFKAIQEFLTKSTHA
jgi:acyl carrier protein